MERAMASRGRMLASLKTLSPTAYKAANYYIPSVDIKNGTPPDIFSRNAYEQIGDELKTYATRKLAIPPEKMEKVEKIASNILNVAPIALDAASSLITGNMSETLNTTTSKAISQTSGTGDVLKKNISTRADKRLELKQNGGRHRRTRRRNKQRR
jgi:hypothetical protein